MKIFATKYALSGGIQEHEVERPRGDDPYIYVGNWRQQFVLGQDAFETMAEAVADADVRRTKKIASLKKQIAALEKLTFGG